MKLSVSELQCLFENIINRLNSSNIIELDFKKDYYWKLDLGEQFDIANNPDVIEIGQISDDLIELKKQLDFGEIDILTLERLCAVLSVINLEYSELWY
ncbi:hypothetical protein [Acinetobacter seifertii]|uniref:Uncharacterized protein n=1 Tax=Acinetobacter seifertii TaxID=1530123 RepID=A0A7H2NIM7_9GAMM|nr:hypothetical protein [Acinetobacter seifertii]MBZ6533867.1 hypothetical protein [Acinetobacter seifertii]QNW90459.1 hypothetical protein IC799_12555 [Acinetobacter seifertii]QNX73355.1 hypothetical protein IC776_05695 [Acinetobacter seifertii]